jgi:hypothetical protein
VENRFDNIHAIMNNDLADFSLSLELKKVNSKKNNYLHRNDSKVWAKNSFFALTISARLYPIAQALMMKCQSHNCLFMN